MWALGESPTRTHSKWVKPNPYPKLTKSYLLILDNRIDLADIKRCTGREKKMWHSHKLERQARQLMQHHTSIDVGRAALARHSVQRFT